MIKQTILPSWNAMRWIRLALGIFIAIQAVQMHDTLSGIIAAFFLFQAITNTGCCGANGCAVPTDKSKSNKIEDIEYEEIKNN